MESKTQTSTASNSGSKNSFYHKTEKYFSFLKGIMAKLLKQFKNFICNLIWLSPFMGGVLSTAQYLIRARGKPMEIGHAVYNDIDFIFRNCDRTAIKEVIINSEYNFLNEFLMSSIEPNIVDIGAHIGTFSLWVYDKNSKAKILMVEANPASHDILLQNIGGIFSDGQFKILNRAAWKNNDILNFSTDGDSLGNKISADGDILITGITLQEIVDLSTLNSPYIDLMKIDIEGAEEAFLFNAGAALDKVRRLVIELHPKFCETEIIISKLKKRYKYVKFISGRSDSKPLLYCMDDL